MTRGQLLQAIVTQRRDRRVAGEAEAYEAMRRYVFDRPALRELWGNWVSENMAAARAALQGEETGPRAAEQVFRRALAGTLAREGRPADEFVYIPLCPRCGDTGMVGEGLQHYCSCVLNAAAQAMRESTGVRPDFTFEAFDHTIFPDEEPLPGSDKTQRALMDVRRDQCMAYADAFPGEGSSLLLTGSNGLGKTYLMHAMANRVVDRGYAVMMATASQLIRASLDRNEGDPLAMYDDADLLLIDDLGSEPMYQKVTVETLFSLINDRMARRMPLVISTNLNPAELHDRYGARIASRILDRSAVQVLRLEGRDVRMVRR